MEGNSSLLCTVNDLNGATRRCDGCDRCDGGDGCDDRRRLDRLDRDTGVMNALLGIELNGLGIVIEDDEISPVDLRRFGVRKKEDGGEITDDDVGGESGNKDG